MLLSLRPNLSEAQLAPLREVARRLGAELCFLDERRLLAELRPERSGALLPSEARTWLGDLSCVAAVLEATDAPERHERRGRADLVVEVGPARFGGGPSGPRTAPGSGPGRGRGPEEDLVVNRRSSSDAAGEIERINTRLKEILRHGNKSLTPEQTEEWIRLGLERLKLPLFSEKGAQSVVEDPANQIDRLVRTGLVSKDVAEGLGVSDGPKPYDPGYLRTLRGMSVMAWAPTAVVAAGVLAMPVAAGTWNVSDLGAWVLFGVGMVNYGVQALLALRYRNFKKTTIEELKSETGQYVAEREIGALGMMYKLIDQYSPLLIFKGRTDLYDGGYPSSKGAILQHIRDAAQMRSEPGLATDEDRALALALQYQAKVKMFEKPLQALMTRWDRHWDTSVGIAGVLGAMPFCGLIAKYMM